MVRIITESLAYGPLKHIVAAGLSCDKKPGAGIVTGSRFTEVDTGVEYAYDEETGRWTPINTGNGRTSIAGAIVTLGAALTYTGSEQTKAVSTVKIGGTTLTAGTDYEITGNKGTEVGDYTLFIIGKGSYTGIIRAPWNIAIGTGSISASPDSLSLTPDGEAGTSTLTVTGDGDVSAVSDDEDVATVALDGTTVTVTPGAAGTATVTLTLAATEHYSGGTETISVTVAAAQEEQPVG